MKTYVFPADTFGCGYYRLIWAAQHLVAGGNDVDVVLPAERDKMIQGKLRDGRMVSVGVPSDADVVVFQRVTNRYLAQAIPLIRASGVAVVVDMDDDLTCIHPANPAFNALHPRNGNTEHSWDNTLRACEDATLVAVSTPALEKTYGRRGNARVLYNMIPKRMLDVPRVDSDVVGWAGSVHSHPTDLQAMGGAVAQHVQTGGRFRIVGPPHGAHAALGIPSSVDLDATGTVHDLQAWPLAVASLGVGVAPLAESKFNTAKSWLKMAEYAAVGVPCIGSPRAEYTRLHRRGVGLLAKNPSDWRAKIRSLTENADLRAELSEKGREVMKSLTIEENSWRWLEVWSDAFKIERSAHRSPLVRSRS